MPSLSKKFWEREVVSNMSTLITVPFIFRENNTFFMASGYRKKSNPQLKVSLTHVFGYYNHQTKQLLWNPKELYPLDVMTHYHDNLFQKLDILNHLLIKNITSKESYKIAYFYRILFYACRSAYSIDNTPFQFSFWTLLKRYHNAFQKSRFSIRVTLLHSVKT